MRVADVFSRLSDAGGGRRLLAADAGTGWCLSCLDMSNPREHCTDSSRNHSTGE